MFFNVLPDVKRAAAAQAAADHAVWRDRYEVAQAALRRAAHIARVKSNIAYQREVDSSTAEREVDSSTAEHTAALAYIEARRTEAECASTLAQTAAEHLATLRASGANDLEINQAEYEDALASKGAAIAGSNYRCAKMLAESGAYDLLFTADKAI